MVWASPDKDGLGVSEDWYTHPTATIAVPQLLPRTVSSSVWPALGLTICSLTVELYTKLGRQPS